VNILVLSLWTGLSPSGWERKDIAVDDFDRPIESIGFCSYKGALPYVIVLAFVDLGALVFAVYEAYAARNISTEFAESQYIMRAMASTMLVSFIGVPVAIIARRQDPGAFLFILGGIILVVCMSLLLLIFVPKVVFHREREKQKKEGQRPRKVHVWSANEGSRTTTQSGWEEADPSSRDELTGMIKEHGSLEVYHHEEHDQMMAKIEKLTHINTELEGRIATLESRRNTSVPNESKLSHSL
jgi:hypothetical protein